jgi:hypothetical protein
MKPMNLIAVGLIVFFASPVMAADALPESSSGVVGFDSVAIFGTEVTDLSSLPADSFIVGVAGPDLPAVTTDDVAELPLAPSVAEPHVYALLLAGVCALAFGLQRRRN